MATLYDKKGTEIYAGRGKYSHRARQMIERREAYTRSEEGALSVYVPAVQTPEPQRASTLQEDARTLKRDAQELGQQLGLVYDNYTSKERVKEIGALSNWSNYCHGFTSHLDAIVRAYQESVNY